MPQTVLFMKIQKMWTTKDSSENTYIAFDDKKLQLISLAGNFIPFIVAMLASTSFKACFAYDISKLQFLV